MTFKLFKPVQRDPYWVAKKEDTNTINKLQTYKDEDSVNTVRVSSINISRKLQNAKPEIKKSLNFKKIKNISKAAPIIQKYLETEEQKNRGIDFVIGGSAAAETQVKRHRDPKDLDIHVKNVHKRAQHIANILRKVYGSKNIKVNPMIIFPDRTKMIQIKIFKNGRWIAAADVKSIVKPGTNLPTVGVHTKVPIKIGKLYYDTVGELIARKASAIEQNYVRPILSKKEPEKRARKDIRDFKKLSKSTQHIKSNPNIKKELQLFEKNILGFKTSNKNIIKKQFWEF